MPMLIISGTEEYQPEPDDEITAAPEGQQDPGAEREPADDQDTDRASDESAQ